MGDRDIAGSGLGHDKLVERSKGNGLSQGQAGIAGQRAIGAFQAGDGIGTLGRDLVDLVDADQIGRTGNAAQHDHSRQRQHDRKFDQRVAGVVFFHRA